MSDANPVNQELETFNKQKLKKTNTQEKNHLPTQAGRSKEGTHKKNNLPAPFYPFFFFLSRPIYSIFLCVAMISKK
uniref:Thymosin beta 1 n=1 Tax=Oryzias latipes TaxID=8090 RepID=A0A3B3IGE5_ORYLA